MHIGIMGGTENHKRVIVCEIALAKWEMVPSICFLRNMRSVSS